jgi:hypothetical protein
MKASDDPGEIRSEAFTSRKWAVLAATGVQPGAPPSWERECQMIESRNSQSRRRRIIEIPSTFRSKRGAGLRFAKNEPHDDGIC